ncbi:protein phosphatase 1E [Biomphalaria pfeifferi]|uniref:Protein phosphatase 1E n=1 Tax=Biomphalaria pfeifferi TaxID=112525 RepID=A0AAD8B424_BIOPF|nr:protein phosphatase 1E [Biomphalaria pfeifferi]
MENGRTKSKAETEYSQFINFFCDHSSEENDDGPIVLYSPYLVLSELEGECFEWIRRYLAMHNCPRSLLSQLMRAVFTRFHDKVKLSDYYVEMEAQQTNYNTDGGTDEDKNVQPQLDAAKLLSKVLSEVKETLLSWKHSPPTYTSNLSNFLVSSYAIKNTRRKMEDKHVLITDLNTLYGLNNCPPQSYFAIFDGHGGLEAATYAATHLHGHLVTDHNFACDPGLAMKQAYKTTDYSFVQKAKREDLRSGTTGISVLIRGSDVHLGWLGDSQAIIVQSGKPVKIMEPHKPEREDEKRRIEALGGCVLFIGTWRVNGNIAVSRAIGDITHKPFISSDADVTSFQLTTQDEYIVIACDGLWDVLDPLQVTHLVYDHVQSSSDDIVGVANILVNAAKDKGSSDNISVIVVFFKTGLADPNNTHLPLGLNELRDTLPTSAPERIDTLPPSAPEMRGTLPSSACNSSSAANDKSNMQTKDSSASSISLESSLGLSNHSSQVLASQSHIKLGRVTSCHKVKLKS